MPTPAPNTLILVTGVTGYIAAHVAEQLLAQGYRVRGTVRTPAKADYLKKEVFQQYGDKFEYVIVEDLVKEHAFDEAVKGVDGIMHVASPFHFNVTDPHKDLIDPAKRGTLSLLEAAALEPKVKRVVVTSSFAAMAIPQEKAGYVYTEADWNTASSKLVEEKGKDVPPAEAYRASKYEAEKAAWDFVEQNKPTFDIATINPSFVFGPLLQKVDGVKELNTSVALLFKLLSGETKQIADAAPSQAFVDVRDVAAAHVKAMQIEKAGGHRFSTTSSTFSWQEVADIFRKHFPENSNIPKGNPGQNYNTKHTISSQAAKEVLGIEFISLEKSIVDTANNLKRFL